MKYFSIKFGKLIEEFSIFPSLSVRWMTIDNVTYYDLFVTLFKWYGQIGQIKKKLKEQGY